MNASFDFGYPWWLNYGHLTIAVIAAAALAVGRWRKWPRWSVLLLAALLLWAGAVAAIVQTSGFHQVPVLPTQNFLTSGKGRVLDLGAGTGRSSIMVLRARPDAELVATDLFADSFRHHFGSQGSPQDRLLANLKVAGVAQRVTIQTADMRRLPFEAASFDAIVSSYAVDHLNREGIGRALSEAARVLKPGGEFLLILVANDGWARLAFGPMLSHGGLRGAAWWSERAREAGFQVREQGTAPVTLYLLLRKP